MKLSELVPGQLAIIQSINESADIVQYLEMGLIPGEKVRFEKRAPLNDPILITVNHQLLSLRNSDAGNILVEVIE